MHRSRIRSTAAASRSSSARSTRPLRASAPTRRVSTPGRALRRRGRRARRRPDVAAHHPAAPSVPARARYGAVGIRSATSVAAPFHDRRNRPHCSPGWRGTRCSRSQSPITAGFGLLLGVLAHHVGWPMAKGGSGAIANALAEIVVERGGTIECEQRVTSLRELPPPRATLLDLTPRQLLAIDDGRLPAALPARARSLPLRTRRVQGRLGARRTHPVVEPGDAARPRRCTSAAPPPRSRRRSSRSAKAAIPRGRTHCSCSRRRSILARAGRQAHRLGVLPCTGGVDRRHDRRDRGAGRAVRARVPRPDPGAPRHGARRDGVVRRQLRRRRHQRRRLRLPAVLRRARACRCTRGRSPFPVCTCAPRRHHPAARCTACAVGTRRAWLCTTTARREPGLRGDDQRRRPEPAPDFRRRHRARPHGRRDRDLRGRQRHRRGARRRRSTRSATCSPTAQPEEMAAVARWLDAVLAGTSPDDFGAAAPRHPRTGRARVRDRSR